MVVVDKYAGCGGGLQGRGDSWKSNPNELGSTTPRISNNGRLLGGHQ